VALRCDRAGFGFVHWPSGLALASAGYFYSGSRSLRGKAMRHHAVRADGASSAGPFSAISISLLSARDADAGPSAQICEFCGVVGRRVRRVTIAVISGVDWAPCLQTRICLRVHSRWGM